MNFVVDSAIVPLITTETNERQSGFSELFFTKAARDNQEAG